MEWTSRSAIRPYLYTLFHEAATKKLPIVRPLFFAREDPTTDTAQPALLLREGAIIPVGPGGQTTTEALAGPLALIVCLDADGHAQGRVYEDAGDGFGYREGDHRLTTHEVACKDGSVEVRVSREEGQRARPHRELHVDILRDGGVAHALGVDGHSILHR